MRLRRPSTLIALTALAGLALAGCASGDGSPANSSQGNDAPAIGDPAAADLTLSGVDGDVTLDAIPQRVVALDYASLDTLHTLGLDAAVVGTSTDLLPESLASFASTTNVGTFFEPDIETIAALDPDLILITGRTAGSEALPELQRLAPTVNVSPDPAHWLDSAAARAADLAALYGATDAATPHLDAIAASADAARASLASAGPGLFITVSGGKLSAYGPGSRFGFVYTDLGLVPAAEISTADSHGQEVSFEFLAQTNPQTLIVMDRDAAIGQGVEGQAAQQVLDNDLVAATDAAKNGRITYVDSADWYLVGGGLHTTATMLDALAATQA